MKQRISSQSGVTLVEMLFIISLLGVLFLIEARLFTASLQIVTATSAADDRIAAMEQMSRLLRQDVWSATRIDVSDDRSVVLANSSGAETRWQFSPGEITRGSQRWVVAGALLPVHDGPALSLRSDRSAERRFISQTILAREIK